MFWVNEIKWYRIGGIPMKFRRYFNSEFIVIAKPK